MRAPLLCVCARVVALLAALHMLLLRAGQAAQRATGRPAQPIGAWNQCCNHLIIEHLTPQALETCADAFDRFEE